MIKKFEEFVNEMYTSRANIGKELVAYLSELGVSENDCSEIYALSQKRRVDYTAEETENIIKRLPGCDSIEGIAEAVKNTFFGTQDDLSKWCHLYDILPEDCPVVMGVTGKLLTGNVIFLNMFGGVYGKDYEDFDDLVSEYGTENGILDDDLPDYNFWEDLIEGVDFEELDLDKECHWTEK